MIRAFPLRSAKLYAILDASYLAEEGFVPMANKLIAGGISVMQIRAKEWPLERIARVARLVLPICKKAGVPLILNDYPDLAAEVGADGVHVGQDDLPVSQAREISKGIVGKSTHSVEQAKNALSEKPDYIAYGPIFATATKPDYTPVGLTNIAYISKLSEAAEIPLFCIGGIRLDNLDDVILAGATRVVIVSALLCSTDPQIYARDCLKKFSSSNA
ncbi:MAG: thiamine phosphate synthase [Chthoniobacterales bacterium]|nr:thiamine phosphate synthase [Chthoniobacterales bacterium]